MSQRLKNRIVIRIISNLISKLLIKVMISLILQFMKNVDYADHYKKKEINIYRIIIILETLFCILFLYRMNTEGIFVLRYHISYSKNNK